MKNRAMGKKQLAAVLLLSAGMAHATDSVVVGDAYVNSAHANTNYGGLSNLAVA